MKMLIYACLPIYNCYKDRYRMFMEMCKYGVRVRMVLLHGEHPPVSEMPEGFEQISLPENCNWIGRKKYLHKYLVPATDDEQTIVHDTFTCQLGRMLRNRWTLTPQNESVRNILSLYSTSPAYLLEGHWLGKSREFRTRLQEWPYFLRRYGALVFVEMLSCQLVDMVTGNSKEIIEDVQKYYRIPAKRTHFIPACINSDSYCHGPAKRDELNLPKDRKLILYAGKLQRGKGLDTLLKAFDLLAKKNSDVYLILVGQMGDTGYCWFRDLLNSLPSSDRIDIRDPVSPEVLCDYHRSCDMFVIPTYHEGSPRVVKEAMACGCPVVTSRISGNFAIDQKGESLVYSSDWSPGEYARLITKVLDDEKFRNDRIEKGLNLVKQLSPEKTAQKYLELYRSLF